MQERRSRDSSKTRVAPVFDQLRGLKEPWIAKLLSLMRVDARSLVPIPRLDYSLVNGSWGGSEKLLDPPVALLSWLIRSVDPAKAVADAKEQRRLLGERDAKTIAEALRGLRSTSNIMSPWYVLEGPTHPDVYLETPDALVVIEGKRTERGATVDTTWLSGRHQIWRHIDAAWEIRGRRRVFGCFIVEGNGGAEDLRVPEEWVEAFAATLAPGVLDSSFPHRSEDEKKGLASCFIGGATWQHVCAAFGLSYESLPRTVADCR